jgi:hypothetical protein
VRRLLLIALLLCPAVPACAQIRIISGAGTGPSTCPQGNSYSDGCAGAPTRTAQLPSILNGYAVRAPWNVVGVDYGAGLPTGTSLSDPTTSPPAGCSYNSGTHTLTCSGNNITVDSFDFTLHGGVKLNMGTATGSVITKNSFSSGTNCVDPLIRIDLPSNGTYTIKSNDVDGNGPTCSPAFETLLFVTGGGGTTTETIQYNYWRNAPSDVLQFVCTAGSARNQTVQFNVFQTVGTTSGAHSDGTQWTACTSTPTVTFNTFYNNGGTVPAQPLHVEAQLTSAITNAVVSNNTVIAAGNCSSFPTNCWANYLLSCKADAPDPGTNTNTGFKAQDNYLDVTAALGYFDDSSAPCGSPFTVGGVGHKNINMVTNTNFADISR